MTVCIFGIMPVECRKLGIHVIPMPVIIDGHTYFEGVDITAEDFYKKQAAGAEITTSQPSPGDVTAMWDRLLKDYDQVIFIPMSSGLSNTCQTAVMLSDDDAYRGKVYVVDNHRISVPQLQSVYDAGALAEEGKTAAEIKEILEKEALDASIYIAVDTLKYLKKGGRITPAAAALGTLLKIKPVLTIDGEKLDAFSKARTIKQAKLTMTTALAHDLEERFLDKEARHTYLQFAHTLNDAAAREFMDSIMELYPGTPAYMDRLPLSIACHIGPGALAIACTKKLEELE